MNAEPSIYFANLQGRELTRALLDKVKEYQRHIINSGYWYLGAKSVQFTKGLDSRGYSSMELRRRGPRGEYTGVKVPQYAGLYMTFMSQLTGQRIVFEPQPGSEDWQASEQARKAKGVLKDALERGFEAALLKSADTAVKQGMAWTVVDFDPHAGAAALPDPETGATIRSGEMTYRSYSPSNCAFDIEARGEADVHWVVLERWEVAHDLMAAFPDHADAILRAVGASEPDEGTDMQDIVLQGHRAVGTQRSRVKLREFRHDATPACPAGRIAWFLGDGTLLLEDDLPFVDESGNRRMCVRRLALLDIDDTAFGFTPMWLLMAMQETLDMLKSIEVTNYRAHGAGVILNPRGSDITPRKIAAGLSVIDHTPGLEPKPMNFTTQPLDLAGSQERTVETMRTTINVSSIAQGAPPASLKSGSALLFVQATTAQGMQVYLNRLTASWEGSAADYLLVFSIFVQMEREVTVPGDAADRVQMVRGEDVVGISRVRLNVGNPLTRSLAGQVQIAENLLAQQMITKEEYFEIVDGGGIEKILEPATKRGILVEQENAMLREGRVPLVSPTDVHPYHMQRHAAELDSQQARLNPAVRSAVLQHLQMHQQTWMQATMMNPGMLEGLGIPLMQTAMGMMGMAPPPGEEPQGGGQEGGAPPVAGAFDGPPDGGQMPNPPRLPPGAAMATGQNPAAPGPGGAQ
jgi:hypothetical protein